MLWQKVDQRWLSRLDKQRDGDVSWKAEQWPVPGEDPLEVRACARDGVPLTKFCKAVEAPRTSIVLHLTCGYGNFQGLMGGSDHDASAHFLLGRCGTPYLLVPTEFTAWHATWWNPGSIGIEIDNIGGLRKQGEEMVSEYSGKEKKDVYCKAEEKEVYLKKTFAGFQYWATLTEKQYLGLGRLLKALCFKHRIPRILLPEAHRYEDFKKDEKIRRDFRGICTHVNIDPARRSDIGPYIDWPKVVQYAGLTEADCYHPPADLLDSWRNAIGGGKAAGEAKNAVRVKIGPHGGRVCLSVKQPGDPLPVAPEAKDAPQPKAKGKRDEFLQACQVFLGAPYKAGSAKPEEGLDGANLIGIALRRAGVFQKDEETPADATHLSALWPVCGGDAGHPPEEILPGDLAWFGKGDHDTDPMQHPMVWLGGGHVLGPIPDGGADSAVQVIAAADVPEKFAAWMHIDDFGDEPPKHVEHPGPAPEGGGKLTSALLPPAPAAQYDALKKVVERAGGAWEDGKGKVNLVGVKGLQDRCLISPQPSGWNDTLFAAFLDADGNKCVLELRASLNPGTDENPSETWQLWEGSWKFKLVDGDSVEGKALQPDGKVKGWLDGAGMGAPRPLDHEQPAEAKDLQPAKPEDEGKEAAPAPKPKPEAKDEKAAPPPDQPFVFDAQSKKLSMKFGMRMMRALIDWELRDVGGERAGCIYSWNGVVKKYKAPPGVLNEWPALEGMQIDPAAKTAGGIPLWHAFGIEWGASGASNCCNSQMAAIFASLPDGKMRIQKSDGLLEVDVVQGTPKAKGIKDHPPDDPKKAVACGSVFSNVWIQAEGSKYKQEDGKKKIFGGYEYIAPAWAMRWLGVGEPVGKWGDEKSLMDVRMGDNACWFSHNWLVGDLRYQVTLKGRKTPVFVDQSDFVRGDQPDPKPEDKGGYKMTNEDCLWVEANEGLFEARLQAFLKAEKLEFEGKDYEVAKIKPLAARVFSANCVAYDKYGTASGVVYEKRTDGKTADDWVRNEEKTQNNRLGLGVSRPWNAFSGQVRKGFGNCWGFARWYDNAGGADWKAEGGADPKLAVAPPADEPAKEDEEKLPPPIDYPGGPDLHFKDSQDKDHVLADKPNKIQIVAEQFEPDPDAWEETICPPHNHFAPAFCADLNGYAKGYKHLSPVQVFGPGKPFKVLDKFVWMQTGGAVFCTIADGTTVGFGHMGEISHRVWKAAKSGEELPAGTWLGSCKTIIGVTTGPHCHMQGWDGAKNVFSNGHALKRDVFLPRLKKG
jgi:N-acetyl-anhydromuramyl-L-alanine amidase AmpD